ncbi:MAG: hypothetical protein IKS83_02135 [Victivallales bacterium]|nr:hypothetical protein [Victivallales bacterium]
MLFLLDIIVSSPPPEPPASWSSAWRLLVALPVGFVLLLGMFWAGWTLARCLKRHAGRVRSNLGETPEVPSSPPSSEETPVGPPANSQEER